MIDIVISGLLNHTIDGNDTLVLLHGDCPRGADALADTWKNAVGITVEPHPADWDKFGKGAGPIRNREMVREAPDLVIAFSDDLEASRGTKDCVEEAERSGIPIWHLRHVGKPKVAAP